MEKKNVWYLVSGILAILGSVTYGIMAIVSLTGLTTDYSSMGGEALTEAEQEMMRTTFIVMLIMSLIWLALAIYASVIFMRSYSQGQIKNQSHSGQIITAIVFCFLGVNILSGIFGIVGLCVKPEQQNSLEGNEIRNASKTVDNLEEKLNKLKQMRDNGLISEEEYQKLRTSAIDKSLN